MLFSIRCILIVIVYMAFLHCRQFWFSDLQLVRQHFNGSIVFQVLEIVMEGCVC